MFSVYDYEFAIQAARLLYEQLLDECIADNTYSRLLAANASAKSLLAAVYSERMRAADMSDMNYVILGDAFPDESIMREQDVYIRLPVRPMLYIPTYNYTAGASSIHLSIHSYADVCLRRSTYVRQDEERDSRVQMPDTPDDSIAD